MAAEIVAPRGVPERPAVASMRPRRMAAEIDAGTNNEVPHTSALQ